MRRFIALIIMLVVPLQSAWSAAAGPYGHLDDNVTVVGFHSHDHDHHDSGHSSHSASVPGCDTANNHNEDGHHDGHCHHAFSPMLLETGLNLGVVSSGGPVPNSHVAFFSHTPPLFDRPPLARA
jgi:hypothetical protein